MNQLFNSNILSYSQINRIKKCSYESLYLLDFKINNDEIILKISGSTLNVYTIILKDIYLTCNCPDFFAKKMFCKHICFVICFIGRIYDENVFIRKSLNNFQKEIITLRILNNCFNEPDIINDFLINKYKNKILKLNDNVILKRNIQDECPICYLEMNENIKDDNKKDIFTCSKCNNCVHMNCMLIWIKNKKNCVYCREEIDTNKSNEEYINISN